MISTIYPVRAYTDHENRIIAEKVTTPARALIAERERAVFEVQAEAASIDAVDAALGDRIADSVYRTRAIDAHHAGHATFMPIRRNIAAELAVSAVYAGQDLADYFAEMARSSFSSRPFPELLAYHAGRAMPDMLPINAGAERVIDETLMRLEAMADAERPERQSFKQAAE